MSMKYNIFFYSPLDSNNQIETIEGKEIVCVGISTNPTKHLHNRQKSEGKDILVLLTTSIFTESYQELIEQIEELRIHKDYFELEPLTTMLKRKCKEKSFVPYAIRGRKKQFRAAKAQQLDTQPISVLGFL